MWRLFVVLIASAMAVVPVLKACTWSYSMWGIRNKSADALFRFVRKDNAGFKSGYIDGSGKIVLRPTIPVDSDSGGEFHEGLLAVSEGKSYRYIDASGKTVFRTPAWFVQDFSEGLAAASVEVTGSSGSSFGFIDRTGRFIIPAKFHWADSFSEGLAMVSTDSEFNSTGFINKQGAFVIPPNLTYGASFHEGRAAVIISGPCRITNGGSCGRPDFVPSEAKANYDCKWAFIDQTGSPISALRFDDAKDFSEDLAPVRIGKLWGYVNRAGQIAIRPIFEDAESFSEGLASVKLRDSVGYIDQSGAFVIRAQFDSAEPFSNSRALVSLRSSDGRSWSSRYIDKAGNAAFPGEFSDATSFHKGLAHVRTGDDQFAWISPAGKRVFVYDVK